MATRVWHTINPQPTDHSRIMSMVERWASGMRALRRTGNMAGQYIARMRMKLQTVDRHARVSVQDDNTVSMTIFGTTYVVEPDGTAYIPVTVERNNGEG